MKSESQGVAEGAVERIGQLLGSALRLPGLRGSSSPGAPAGIDRRTDVDLAPEEGAIELRRVDYGPTLLESHESQDLDALLKTPKPDGCKVRWINVDGIHPQIINRLRMAYNFYTLAAEDILHIPQRSKMELYEGHVFVVVHMLMLRDGALVDEQVSFVMFEDTILTFQERPGDVWDPVRKRLSSPESRLRKGSAGYLLYALLDAVVDHVFPILEHFGDRLEEVEERIMERPSDGELKALYEIKRELVLLRRVLWPLRQVTDDLHRSEDTGIKANTRTFLRDVYDHTIQALDIVETYREMTGGLTDLYMSALSHRMNEIMKVLTIMASLFIPITFFAGVYGMNFEHIPELGWRWSYPAFWVLCLSTLAGLVLYFRRKGWLGGT